MKFGELSNIHVLQKLTMRLLILYLVQVSHGIDSIYLSFYEALQPTRLWSWIETNGWSQSLGNMQLVIWCILTVSHLHTW